MHIDFDIKVQKIDSNAFDFFLPEEKDWLLNRAQYRFIKQRSSEKSNRKQEGSDKTYKRYEDLEALYTRTNIPMYIGNDNEHFFGLLPHDFFDIRNAKCNLFYNCNGINNVGTIQETDTISVLRFADDTVSTNLFNNFLIRANSISQGVVNLFNINNYPNIVDGGSFKINKQKFIIVNHVIEILNRRNDIEVYWEHYGNRYGPSSFIIINKSDYTDFTISFGSYSQTSSVSSIGESKYNDNGNKLIKGRAIRFVETEDLYDILDHDFYTTTYKSPVGTFRERQIQVYHNEKFILNELQIDYIRTPRLISLSLEQSCELPSSRHDEIVDIAVQLATAYIGSDVHKNIINENLLSE